MFGTLLARSGGNGEHDLPLTKWVRAAFGGVLWIASDAVRCGGGSELRFQLYRLLRGVCCVLPWLVTLAMHCGPGDEGEAVITIGLPGED